MNDAIFPFISSLDSKVGSEAMVIMRNYAYAKTYISYAIEACFGILMIFLLYALMKQYGYKSWFFILGIVIVKVASGCDLTASRYGEVEVTEDRNLDLRTFNVLFDKHSVADGKCSLDSLLKLLGIFRL